MSDKIVGAIFCLCAAVLLSAWYLSAACFMSGVSTWSGETFRVGLDYVGSLLPGTAAVFLISGLAFLFRGLRRGDGR